MSNKNEEFREFTKKFHLSDDNFEKLWEEKITSVLHLAWCKPEKLLKIVDDPVLCDAIHPLLHKKKNKISRAKDPYEYARNLIHDSDDETDTGGKAQGKSNAYNLRDGTFKNLAVGTDNNIINSMSTDTPEKGSQKRNISKIMGTTAERKKGHKKSKETSNEYNLINGDFEGIGVGKGNIVVNIPTNDLKEGHGDFDADRQSRRSKKLKPTPMRMQGMTFFTSDLQFHDNSNFWLDNVTVQPADEQVYEQRLSDSTVYQVPTWNSNRALIINNVEFLDKKNSRQGAEADTTNLERVLKQLGFRVYSHVNKRKSEIEQILKDFASNRENSNAAMSFVFIGSHGEQDESKDFFFGTDKLRLSAQSVCDYFSASNCRDLAGKPKLFFFQCCRSNKVRPNIASDAVEENVSANIDFLPSTNSDTTPYVAQHSMEAAHNMADMLISFATAPGTKAYRDTADGAWFVTTLCKVLQEHSSKEDLLSMLTIVNNSVMAKRGDDKDGQKAVQMAEFKSTLSKKVRFYPRRNSS